MLRTVARPGVIVAGILALLAAAFLIAGILLPGTVEVTRTVEIDAPPETVFALVNNLEAWTEWTPWGEVDSRLEGPAEGPGARRVWDDPSLGSGSLTLLDARPPASAGAQRAAGPDTLPPVSPDTPPPASVRYLVEVEGAAIRFEGTISIEPGGPGSIVSWTEQADLGWNPILGWTALTLDESQGRQLDESLERLRQLAERRSRSPGQRPAAQTPRVSPVPG